MKSSEAFKNATNFGMEKKMIKFGENMRNFVNSGIFGQVLFLYAIRWFPCSKGKKKEK